ncbi:MAG: MFS transporter [Candidatus Heimdallarchaeota archaeon]
MIEKEIKDEILEDGYDANGKPNTRKTKFSLYIIAAVSSSANFVARTYMGLYAVAIGSSASALSLITSLRNLIQQVFQFTFGRISDRVGRKIMMIIGLIISGISIGLFPLITNEWVLVGGVVGFSIGFASYYPSFTALQGDITNKKNRAGLISIITIFGAFATLISLLVVGTLGNLGETELQQYLIILEIVAGLFLISAIVTVFLRDPPRKKLIERKPFSFDPIRRNKNFRRFVIFNSIVAFAMSIGWPIFPIIRGTYATAQQNSWIWAAFAALQIIVLLITRKIIDKMNRKKLLFIGRLLMFYVPLNMVITLVFQLGWWHFLLAGALSGASNAFYMVGQSSYILDSATEKEKGTYMGVHNLFIGLSTFLGSLLMGIIADVLLTRFNDYIILIILTAVVAGARFITAFSFLFLKEPVQTKEYDDEPFDEQAVVNL